MSLENKEILEKIGKLKERVKEIVQNIQTLKGQLETAQIPLKDFKEKKSVLENELRGILQQITKTKETHQIAPTIHGKPLPKDDSPESRQINQEVLFAKEAEDLMYYFSTEFEDMRITKARVYLSITVDATFIIGIDYEKYPDEHCKKTGEILKEKDWPEDYIRAVVSHGWGLCYDVEPQTLLEKTLYAIDELTGLITACALVRPSKSVMDLKPKSVRKKWKAKGFAAGADRTVIEQGAQMLGVEINELISDTIMGMREVAPEIGLG